MIFVKKKEYIGLYEAIVQKTKQESIMRTKIRVKNYIKTKLIGKHIQNC